MESLGKQKTLLLLANIVSRLTEPLFWLPVMIWLVVNNVRIPAGKQLIYYPVLLLFVFVIPCGYFLYLLLVKKEFDIDITERGKRLGYTLKSMISFGIGFILTYYMDQELFVITGAVFLSTLILIVVTARWKISFHGGLNTLVFCTVNYFYHWRFWWMFLLLIPIGMARLIMKKHSLAQFVAGTVVCGAIFLSVTSFL